MRLPRVVASAALIVALALVVVPGSVGSRTPSGIPDIDLTRLQPLQARSASDGTMAATTQDPAYRSDGAVDTGDLILDPADAPEPPVRPAIDGLPAPV
ncbi:MAG TPA: hypothetical protein VM344_10510, partial [Vitreimonas sp.]|nr:hypothetical protein [Vitreimonas sp.]